MKGIGVNALVHILRNFFATFGLPRQLLSDNGPAFGLKTP